MTTLLETLQDSAEALDLAQSLLEQSFHHGRILAAYNNLHAAITSEESRKDEPPAIPAGYRLIKNSTHKERSYPDDASDENGQYSNECMECGRQFTGHKRRLHCRVCVKESWKPAAAQPLDEPLPQGTALPPPAQQEEPA